MSRPVRLAVVGILYLLGAGIVQGVGRELAAILVLPPLFRTLLAGALLLGLPLALVLAWQWEGGEGEG